MVNCCRAPLEHRMLSVLQSELRTLVTGRCSPQPLAKRTSVQGHCFCSTMTVHSTMRSSEDVLTLYLCARVRWWRCVCTTVGLNVEERVNDLADSEQDPNWS